MTIWAFQTTVKYLHQGCLPLIFLSNEHSFLYCFTLAEFWYIYKFSFGNICSIVTIRLNHSGFIGYLRTFCAVQRMWRCTGGYDCCLGVSCSGQESAMILSFDSQNLNKAPSEYSSVSLLSNFVRILCCFQKDNLVHSLCPYCWHRYTFCIACSVPWGDYM
jgi:hypothetical protein